MNVQETISLVLGRCLKTRSLLPPQLLPSSQCGEVSEAGGSVLVCVDVTYKPRRTYISGGKPDFCLSHMGQVTVPTRH